MNKLQLHIAVLIVLASAKFSYPQPIFTSSSLGLSLKYGNIDRSRLDRQSTVVADFNNDMLEDAVKLDRSMNSLNYYVNEGNGYVGLIKSIGVGNAESVSLISSGISQNSVAVIYKDKSVRVVTQTELNSTAMEIPTFNPPFK